jgi:hypothetical protein
MILFCMFLQFFEKYNYYANKMKNKEIPHNGWNNYVERDNIDTANTQMHDAHAPGLAQWRAILLTHEYITAHAIGLAQWRAILLTHKYMTAHAPGLAQWRAILLTHKCMTAHAPGLAQ